MDIINIVNSMQPNTIVRFGYSNVNWPGKNQPVPFMGGYAELAEGATLPSSDAVTAYEATYNAAILQASLLSALAAHRYDVENGGTTVAGNSYKTDPESRLALTAVFIIASSNSAFTANWKMADGTFVNLSASQIIAAATGVLAFVQKCFDTEKTLVSNLSNYSSVNSIISAFDTAMAS